ncbi:hypothetical protein SAMN05518684_102277 [Salipaludibacillus aurantiacus]|uniref:Uncharacterized protein n=1 Tax=Salipaludibacillus aurantiacus TaxID=1601833 RepID=A0A1H9QLI4_9BACI|nr:hypothetical protein SAMN05518684_102277 [Salipaludibacillus aurantiacus]
MCSVQNATIKKKEIRFIFTDLKLICRLKTMPLQKNWMYIGNNSELYEKRAKFIERATKL